MLFLIADWLDQAALYLICLMVGISVFNLKLLSGIANKQRVVQVGTPLLVRCTQ